MQYRMVVMSYDSNDWITLAYVNVTIIKKLIRDHLKLINIRIKP